jgi:hypothetical protein
MSCEYTHTHTHTNSQRGERQIKERQTKIEIKKRLNITRESERWRALMFKEGKRRR